jgi:hypothetical protein
MGWPMAGRSLPWPQRKSPHSSGTRIARNPPIGQPRRPRFGPIRATRGAWIATVTASRARAIGRGLIEPPYQDGEIDGADKVR